MPNVIFTLPFALEATLRFVRAGAALPGYRLGVIGQEPLASFPDDVKRLLQGHQQVADTQDPDQLLAAVRAISRTWNGNVDCLIGILEQLQEPLAVVRERLRIPGMDVETAHNFREKARMKARFGAAGVPCARHRLCNAAADALQFGQTSGYPVVVKPPAGAGARNTFRVDREAELRAYLDQTPPSPANPVLLEEFIVGDEYSCDSVSVGGRVVFHSISRYSPPPLQVLQHPWIQWCVLLPRDIDGPEFAPIRAAAPRALRSLGMVTGISHMEWFRRHDGSIAISEVAARPPGAQFTSLISYAHGLDFYRAWIELMAEAKFTPPARQFAVGCAFLRGQGQGRVTAVTGLETAQRELGDIVVEARLPRPGQAPAGTYEGEGYVIVKHRDTAVVERALHRLITTLRIELG